MQMDLKGKKIKIWSSIRRAGRELGINHTGINAVLHGRQETSYGFKWKKILRSK